MMTPPSPARTIFSMSLHTRRALSVGLIFLAVFAVVGVSQWRAAHAKEIVPWREDFSAAMAEAKAQHKDVFAYFTASWCGPCQNMKHGAWADEAVRAAIVRRFVPVRIDVDQHPDLTKQYNVDAMPTMIVLSDDGSVIRRTVGGRDAEEMLAWVEH